MANYQDIIADFHYKNKEKLDSYLNFQIPKGWEQILNILNYKKFMLPKLYT